MIATLNYLNAELKLDISTLCHHLRNKAYPQKSDQLYSAMSSMVYYQVLVDELNQLIFAHGQVVAAIQKYLRGEEYDTYSEDEPLSIHAFCLSYFESGELPLGTATPELLQWVATHADRQQDLRQGFYSFFPDIGLNIDTVGEEGGVDFRPASDAEKFKSDTTGFLKDIETSNALIEFNQFMQSVRLSLKQNAPIGEILISLNDEKPI